MRTPSASTRRRSRRSAGSGRAFAPGTRVRVVGRFNGAPARERTLFAGTVAGSWRIPECVVVSVAPDGGGPAVKVDAARLRSDDRRAAVKAGPGERRAAAAPARRGGGGDA